MKNQLKRLTRGGFLLTLLLWLPGCGGGGGTDTGSGSGSGTTTRKQVFSYTGVAQSFVVPAGVTSLAVELWGAGGGQNGGSGAYIGGDLTVSPGETLTLLVGQGGQLSLSGSTIPAFLGGGSGLGGSGGFSQGTAGVKLTGGDGGLVSGGGGGGSSRTSNLTSLVAYPGQDGQDGASTPSAPTGYSTDPDYVSGVGIGGANAQVGGHGLLVISYKS